MVFAAWQVQSSEPAKPPCPGRAAWQVQSSEPAKPPCLGRAA